MNNNHRDSSFIGIFEIRVGEEETQRLAAFTTRGQILITERKLDALDEKQRHDS